jgi:YhcH/YjgK/YiaL family protein
MILGSLKSTSYIEKINPFFKTAFDYIRNTDFTTMEASPERIEVVKDFIYLLLFERKGKKHENATRDSHRNEIEIHFPIIGREIFGWIDKKECETIASIDSKEDLIFYKDSVDTYIMASAGQFVVFFPEDVHAPGIGFGHNKKGVIKILV